MTTKQSSIFLSTEELKNYIDNEDIKLLDVRLYDKYKEGHLPDSMWVDSNLFTKMNIEGYNEVPDKQLVEKVLQDIGINKGDKICLVDDVFNLNCSIIIWTLNFFGIKDVFLIDGALAKWKVEGRPITTEIKNNERRGDITLVEENYDILITRDEIILNMDSHDHIPLDTRSEFAVKMDQQGGTLPHAVHYWWMNFFEEHPESFFTIRPKDELLSELEENGVTLDKTVIPYCDTVPQSALVFFILKEIGFKNVKLYLAGYNEWRLCVGFI